MHKIYISFLYSFERLGFFYIESIGSLYVYAICFFIDTHLFTESASHSAVQQTLPEDLSYPQ